MSSMYGTNRPSTFWLTIPGDSFMKLGSCKDRLAEYRMGGLIQEWRVIWKFSSGRTNLENFPLGGVHSCLKSRIRRYYLRKSLFNIPSKVLNYIWYYTDITKKYEGILNFSWVRHFFPIKIINDTPLTHLRENIISVAIYDKIPVSLLCRIISMFTLIINDR